MKNQAHDCAPGKKQLAPDRFMRQLRIQGFQQLPDSLRGQHHTRSPTLESMKIFRRRKGGGETVNKWARKLRDGSMNTGLSSGATSAVQSGGIPPARCAATSTMAVT